MAQEQIMVKVRDNEQIERIITYRSFKMVTDYEKDKYVLIGQVDESGNLIPGNPNLPAQYQNQQAKSDAVHAVDIVQQSESFPEMEISTELEPISQSVLQEVPNEPKKRGRKPKLQTA